MPRPRHPITRRAATRARKAAAPAPAPTRDGAAPAERLRLPAGHTLSSLCDGRDRNAVAEWLRGSPDHTLYHLPAYLNFLRGEGAVADVLLLAGDGAPLFALPIHSWDATGVSGGYSGVLFPDSARERTLRRSVRALGELLAANDDFAFRLCQSVQAHAYEDSDRTALLQCLLESEGLALERMYCWLRRLDDLPADEQIPTTAGRSLPGALELDGDWLGAEPTRGYDQGTRKKIRNALAAGLRVEYVCAGTPELRDAAYARYQPVHVESWARTGLLPKPPGLWSRLGAAVTEAGGLDLVVLVLDRDEEAVAGLICHLYRGRALYWSGCSSARGLAMQANPLGMHAAILACRREGATRFELGRFRADERSAKERDVTRYKSHFANALVRVAAYSSTPRPRARARASAAEAVAEARRQLAVRIARARVSRRGAGAYVRAPGGDP